MLFLLVGLVLGVFALSALWYAASPAVRQRDQARPAATWFAPPP